MYYSIFLFYKKGKKTTKIYSYFTFNIDYGRIGMSIGKRNAQNRHLVKAARSLSFFRSCDANSDL